MSGGMPRQLTMEKFTGEWQMSQSINFPELASDQYVTTESCYVPYPLSSIPLLRESGLGPMARTN